MYEINKKEVDWINLNFHMLKWILLTFLVVFFFTTTLGINLFFPSSIYVPYLFFASLTANLIITMPRLLKKSKKKSSTYTENKKSIGNNLNEIERKQIENEFSIVRKEIKKFRNSKQK